VLLFAQAFWLPKSGNSEEEYEDAFWPRNLHLYKQRSDFRVGVADGATESSFSALWAKLLVRSYVDGQLLPQGFELSLKKLQHRWSSAISRRPLPWYAEDKVRAGAAAAFIGLHLQDENSSDEGGHWESIALGDCCLVQLRAEEIIERFPLAQASAFSNNPFLLSSNASACEGWPKHLKTKEGRWVPEDSFYLMSDAVAAWFMHEDESGRTPWQLLRDLGTSDGPVFTDFVEELRRTHEMRNDDVTIVRVYIES